MSEDDTLKAVRNVVQCALNNNFVICVVDNCSPKKQEKLKKIQGDNIHVIYKNSNSGYGVGNNAGIMYLSEFCSFKYTVIMNPDVLIRKKGTIEALISEIEHNRKSGCVGAQPLTITASLKEEPTMQENIRRAVGTLDTIVYTSSVWKRIFSKRFRNITYYEQRPYIEHQYFDVPSGAFFVVDTKEFEKIGYFDKDTFLYFEEFFIGYRFKEKGKKFLFCPEWEVDHFQGKSTNSRAGNLMSRNTNRYTVNAQKQYLIKCLGKKKYTAEIIGLYLVLEYEAIHFLKKLYLKIRSNGSD